jgi:hypothetical protein
MTENVEKDKRIRKSITRKSFGKEDKTNMYYFQMNTKNS